MASPGSTSAPAAAFPLRWTAVAALVACAACGGGDLAASDAASAPGVRADAAPGPGDRGDAAAPEPVDGHAAGASRPDTTEVDPVLVGMDPDSLALLDHVLDSAVAAGAAPGAALAIGRHGRLVRLRGYGVLDPADPTPVGPGTIFDLASLTKVVGTTSAVMALVQEDRLRLDDPVVEYLPWWSGGQRDKESVTIRQLLSHQAGLAPFRRWYFDISGVEAYREALAAEPLVSAPGAETRYSDLGVITLGFVVEAASGEPLDQFLDAYFFLPLGMDDTAFRPAAELRPRIAPTEVDTVYRHTHLRGQVHDENAWAMGGVAGHAGLFSTARDLSVFAYLMMNDGWVPFCRDVRADTPCRTGLDVDSPLLESSIIRDFTTPVAPSTTRALGWDTPGGRSSAGDYFTCAAFGHTGYTGTSIWMDPELDLFVVLLTNRVNPTRENTRHVPLRRRIHDLAARAITDRSVSPRPGSPAALEQEGSR